VHSVTCNLLWVRCLFDLILMSDFGGKWPLKWKFSKMSFRIPQRDTELRFVTKFGENRPLRMRSCWKVVWFTKQTKNSHSAGLVPAPILAKMGRLCPKFPERCHPLTCPRKPNLIRIGYVLPDLFQTDCFFRPKKSIQYRLLAYNELRFGWIVVKIISQLNSIVVVVAGYYCKYYVICDRVV